MPAPRPLLTTLLAACLLAGCGLKGSLYLPEKKPEDRDPAAREESEDDDQRQTPAADASAQP